MDAILHKVAAAVLGMEITKDHRAALITISPPFNAASKDASKWIKKVREILDHYLRNRTDVNVYLASCGGSAGPVLYDYNERSKEVLPVFLGIILGIVFLIVAAIFRSVFIPLRLILGVVFNVAVTFGLSYYVFQTQAFEWMFPYLKSFRGDALCWIVPSLAISITMGLALDYDIFLLARVVEFREYGYSDRASILKAAYKSGGIISGAGIIMSIAFGGLLLSKIEALNQFGLILVVSVLLSTFVIRIFFTPPIMFLLGRVNWLPRQYPMASLTESDFKEETEHLSALDLIDDGASSHALSPHN